MARNLSLSTASVLVNMLANSVRGGEKINAIDMMANIHLVKDEMADMGLSEQFWQAASLAYTHRLPDRPRGTYRALVKSLASCPEFTGWLAERSIHGRLVDRDGIILMPMGAEG